MLKSGLVHTVECTTANVADNTMMEACLHGEETLALGDRGYYKKNRTIVKVRYRGLAKNTGQIVTLFALANLWLARKRLLPLLGEVRP